MTTTEHAKQTAQTIRSQIQVPIFWALGVEAHSIMYTKEGGLTFLARILPFTKAGDRSTRPAKMRVTITHNAADLYDIEVTYDRPRGDLETHAKTTDVDASTLNNALLALDYDGDTPFNPRYYTA